MRILLVSKEVAPETGWGGIGTYVAEMAPALAELGHEVHVLSILPDRERADVERQGVSFHWRLRGDVGWVTELGRRLGIAGTMERLRAGFATAREVRALTAVAPFDVIEFADWGGEGWLAAALPSAASVVHLHTPLQVIVDYDESSRFALDTRAAVAIESIALRRCSLVTAPARLLVRRLRLLGFFPEDDVRVIPYPMRLAAKVPPAAATDAVLLFVGRLEKRKAPEVLVDAARLLQGRGLKLRVRFLGASGGRRDGMAYGEWVKARARGIDGCEFLGAVPRSEVERHLAEARVVIVPSLFDNFPYAALEAMAAARPVVVTDSTGVADLVAASGGGAVVPAGDVARLATALEPYIADPRLASRAGAKAAEAVREPLDPRRVAAERVVAYAEARRRFQKSLVKSGRSLGAVLLPRVGSLRIPEAWVEWAVAETVDCPWKHFYMHAARQLLSLLAASPVLHDRRDLEGVSVVDVGATPAVSALLALMGATVTLVDNSQAELEKAAGHARLLGITSKVRYLRADILSMPLGDCSFDVAWNCGVVEHFEDPKRYIAEMRRVVRPEGTVALLVPAPLSIHALFVRGHMRRTGGYPWDYMGRERSYSARQLAALVTEAGLTVARRSTADLPRSLLDDNSLLPWFERRLGRAMTLRAMRAIAQAERVLPFMRPFGFLAGVSAVRDAACDPAAPR